MTQNGKEHRGSLQQRLEPGVISPHYREDVKAISFIKGQSPNVTKLNSKGIESKLYPGGGERAKQLYTLSPTSRNLR